MLQIEGIREMRHLVRITIGALVIGAFCRTGSGQTYPYTATHPDSAILRSYESFFTELAPSPKSSSPVLLNGGEAGVLPQPTLKDAVGLSDEEAQAVEAVALSFVSMNNSLVDRQRPLRFEALLQHLETGRTSEKIDLELNRLENIRRNLVLENVKKVADELGNARFQPLNSYILTRKI